MTSHYQDVRSRMREFSLADSLWHVWRYALRVCDGVELPPEYAHLDRWGRRLDVKEHIFEFQLELLLREVIINASRGGTGAKRSLQRWDDLATIQNLIKGFADRESNLREPDSLMLILHRISHQQMALFDKVGSSHVGRYWALYNREPLKSVIESALGMSISDYFLLSVLVLASLRRSPLISAKWLSRDSVINEGICSRFVSRLTIPLDELRARLIDNQDLGACWEHTYTPLCGRPLITLDPREPDHQFCPMPSILARRLFQGLFFDIADARGFADAYGKAIEEQVGDLFCRLAPSLTRTRTEPYETSHGRRYGADWIVSDASANVFVECKAARIAVSAKVAASLDHLKLGLSRLGDAIVQNYKNILDALDGRTAWTPNGQRCFSLIVTIEDWLLFSPAAREALEALVREKLIAARIPEAVLDEVPYVVASATELQGLAGALERHGISAVLEQKLSPQFRPYLVSAFLGELHPDDAALGRHAFDEDFNRLFNDLKVAVPSVTEDKSERTLPGKRQ